MSSGWVLSISHLCYHTWSSSCSVLRHEDTTGWRGRRLPHTNRPITTGTGTALGAAASPLLPEQSRRHDQPKELRPCPADAWGKQVLFTLPETHLTCPGSTKRPWHPDIPAWGCQPRALPTAADGRMKGVLVGRVPESQSRDLVTFHPPGFHMLGSKGRASVDWVRNVLLTFLHHLSSG